MGPKWPKTNSGPKGAQKLIMGHLRPRKKYWAGGPVPCAGVRTGGGPPPHPGQRTGDPAPAHAGAGSGGKNPPPAYAGAGGGGGVAPPRRGRVSPLEERDGMRG